MCLTFLTSKEKRIQRIKKYPNKKLIKVYKAFKIVTFYDKIKTEDDSFETVRQKKLIAMYANYDYKPGWNHTPTVSILSVCDGHYPAGFHSFNTLKGAKNWVKSNHEILMPTIAIAIMPVYFYKSQIVAMGKQLKHSCIITYKLYIKPEDYKEAMEGL